MAFSVALVVSSAHLVPVCALSAGDRGADCYQAVPAGAQPPEPRALVPGDPDHEEVRAQLTKPRQSCHCWGTRGARGSCGALGHCSEMGGARGGGRGEPSELRDLERQPHLLHLEESPKSQSLKQDNS